MKKNLMFSILLLILIGCNRETLKSVEFNFTEKIKIKENFQYPAKIVTSKVQLEHIFSQKHKPLYLLKDFIDYDKYDFKKYDYLFSFSKEVINIEETDDECDYLTKKPIKVTYSEHNAESFIYVYIIVDKNKYRDLCP